MTIRYLLILLFLFAPSSLKAVDSLFNKKGSSGIAFNVLPGFLWGHKENVINVQSHNMGYSMDLYRNTDGSRWWHRYYNFPRIGLSLYYNALGHNEIVGKVIAGMPYFEFNILKRSKSHLVFRLGTGLGYHTRKFDVNDNIKNKVIGSSFTCNMFAGLLWHRSIANKLELNLGIALNHYSNGHLKEPNYGINMPSLYGGLGYRFSDQKRSTVIREPKSPAFHKHHFQGHFMFTMKEELSSFSEKFYIKGLHLGYGYQRSKISKLTAGTDIWLDKSYFSKTHPGETNEVLTFDRQLEVGIRGGHELRAGNLCLITDLGVYVYKPYDFKKRIYERLGLRYYLSPNLFLNGTLKVHYGRADYMEFGVGVDL